MNLQDQIPSGIARQLARNDDSGFGAGFVRGIACYAVVLMVFVVLPAARSVWELGGTWRLMLSPVFTLVTGSILGAVYGALVLWLLAATVAKSKSGMQGAERGFVLGCLVGAILGAGVVLIGIASGTRSSIGFVWVAHGDSVTSGAITLGSISAAIGSIIGAIWCRSEVAPEIHTADREGTFQFGILRILALTAAVAIVIAVPIQILRRLRGISELGNYSIAFNAMAIPLVVLMLMIVVWAVMRGPLLLTRFKSSVMGRRRLKRHREDLAREVARRSRDQ